MESTERDRGGKFGKFPGPGAGGGSGLIDQAVGPAILFVEIGAIVHLDHCSHPTKVFVHYNRV